MIPTCKRFILYIPYITTGGLTDPTKAINESPYISLYQGAETSIQIPDVFIV